MLPELTLLAKISRSTGKARKQALLGSRCFGRQRSSIAQGRGFELHKPENLGGNPALLKKSGGKSG